MADDGRHIYGSQWASCPMDASIEAHTIGRIKSARASEIMTAIVNESSPLTESNLVAGLVDGWRQWLKGDIFERQKNL